MARLILVHNKKRLSFSILGVALAVVVTFLELGFFNGFGDSQTNIIRMFNADLVVISKTKEHMMLTYLAPMLQSQLYQALAYDAVDEVIPIYEGLLQLKNPDNEMVKNITVIAFPVGSAPLKIKGLKKYIPQLHKQGTVLYDAKSRDIYGNIRPGMEIELSDVTYKIAGFVEIGANFSQNGHVLMGAPTWLRHPKAKHPHHISFGLIRVKPGCDLEKLKTELGRIDPDNLDVYTPNELQKRERRFFEKATPVGILFGTALTLGFLIGVMICYQILFSEITDNIVQYATMMAIGFSRRYLTGVVIRIALVLSLFGFWVGLLASWGLYELIAHRAAIPMFLTPARIALIFGLTICMSVFSALIATTDLFKARPADVF